MAADRTNTQQHAEHKPAAEEQGRSPGKLTGANGPVRPSYSADDAPSVSLGESPAAGQSRGPHIPVPPPRALPPRTSPGAPLLRPAFTVSAFTAGGAGNATLTPGGDLLVDSPLFQSSARVQSPGGVDVPNWDIGYIQTATAHFLENRYRHTTENWRVAVPVRDSLAGTPEPWYRTDALTPARPGRESAVAMDDHPFHHASWDDPRTGELNALITTTRRFALAAWLIARHRTQRTMIFLKNIVWSLSYVVNVNSAARVATNAGPGMTPPATGDGQGGTAPVLSGTIYNTALNDLSNRARTPVAGSTSARAPAPAPPRASAPVRSRPPAPPTRVPVAPPVPASASSAAVTLSPAVAPAARGELTPEIAKLVSGQSGGEPLPSSILAQLETTLDVPLGLVRVHSDSRTRAVVDGSGARAFTYGLHIYLGSQASASDLALMAHEITHVIQQQGRPVLQMYTAASTGDTFEYEAHRVSSAAQQGQRATVEKRTAGARVQAFWPVSQIVDWIEDRAWDLVNRFAPDLAPIIRKGPLEWLKEKIVNAVNAIVDTVMAPVRAITGLASALRGHFANLLTWLRDAAAKIARGDCSSITEAAHKIHEVFMGIASPIIERIQGFARRVRSFFGDLWDRFGAPVWAFLRRIGGAVWERIQSFGRWIWDITAPIRRALMRAWRWIKNKLGIGEGPEGQNGILQWVQRKAQTAWDDYILPFIERFRRPLLVVGGILLMLSPAGPIIAIGAIAYGVIRGVQAIRQYFGTRGGIVNGRNILQNEIIPGIVSTINRVAAFLRERAQFLADKLNSIVGGLGNAAGAVAGTIISFIARGLTWLAERFGELVNWVMDHVMSFVNWVGSVLQRLVTFLQPVLDFLRRVAAVIRNVMRIGYEFGARIWNAIPACIRDPFIDFFIPLILRQIPFFAELGSTPEAWQQTRASIMLLVRQIFRDFDLWGAMRTAFGIVVRALRIPVDLIRQLIDKASRAWDAVLAAPIRFIRSALHAILRGMGRFMGNFLSHLWYGVQGWLFNAVSDRGITPPSSWTDLRAVFGFVLDVLGISLDHVLDLLATRIGRPAVARIRTVINVLTGVWEWVSVAIREGPAGIWRMIVERLRDLGTMVLETAVRWVMTRIIAIVGARIAAMAATAGLSAVLEAVVAIYQAIQTAIEYARRIIQVLITIFDTVLQIAQGVIDPAAAMVETGLRMIMPVVIGFLANYAGLGGIGQRLREIIDGVRERVDQGILWLIDRALAAGRWLLGMLAGGETPQDRLRNAVNDAQRAIAAFSGRRVGAIVLRPLLAVVKLRYGLTTLDVVPSNGHWAIHAVINPTLDEETPVLVEGEEAGEFVYEKPAGTNTDKVRRDLTVVRFPQQTPLTGAPAQSVLQSALESIVVRQNVQYTPDGLGRASHSYGHVSGVKDGEERASLSATGLPGYQPGDHRGHLVGDRFYGSNQPQNLVPMHPTLNLSTFKSYENTLATDYKNHKDANEAVMLHMSIEPAFPGDDQTNPASWRPTSVSGASTVITLQRDAAALTKHETPHNCAPLTNPDAVISDFYINTDDDSVMRALRLHPRLIAAIKNERSAGRFRPPGASPIYAMSALDSIKSRLFPRLGTFSYLLAQLDPLETKIRF